MAGNSKKISDKKAVVLPYAIWNGLKRCEREVIIDTIDLMIAYDYRWLENEKSGLPQTIPKPQTNRKLNQIAETVFLFSQPMIDANNRRYYGKQLAQIDKERGAGTTAKSMKDFDDLLPDGL